MLIDVLRKSCLMVAIILFIILINMLYEGIFLKINVLEIKKTNILISENRKVMHTSNVEEFFYHIEQLEYDVAYDKLDKQNAEYKFGSIKLFKDEMKQICFTYGEYNSNNDIQVMKTTEKEKYTDTDIKCNFYEGENIKYINMILRNYRDNTYKIFITNYSKGG